MYTTIISIKLSSLKRGKYGQLIKNITNVINEIDENAIIKKVRLT